MIANAYQKADDFASDLFGRKGEEFYSYYDVMSKNKDYYEIFKKIKEIPRKYIMAPTNKNKNNWDEKDFIKTVHNVSFKGEDICNDINFGGRWGKCE